AARENYTQAVRLYAEAAKLRQIKAILLPPTYRLEVETRLERARTALGQAEFDKAWTSGPNKPGNHSVTTPARPPAAAPAHSKSLAELTARELEVLRLVAQGLTNSQVAAKLFVSPATINVHLTSIYSKLGVNSRNAA